MLPEIASVTGTGNLQSLLDAVAPQLAELEPPAKKLACLIAFGRRANAQADRSISAVQDAMSLLHDAAALCSHALEADLSGIGQYDQRRNKLTLRIGRADIRGTAQWSHVRDIEVRPDANASHDSMAGYALSIGGVVLCADLNEESRFSDAFLADIGIRSAITAGVDLGGVPFGTLGVYSTSKRCFTEQEAQFLEAIASVANISIARLWAQQALARQTLVQAQLLQQVDSLVFGLDEQGRIVSMNAAAERTTGFQAHEIRGRHVVSVLVAARDAGKLGQLLRQATRESQPVQFDMALIAKDGKQRWCSWKIAPLGQQPSPEEPALLLTGTDRTEEIEAKSQAERATAAAERSAKKVQHLYQRLADGERPTVGEVLAAAQESVGPTAARWGAPSPAQQLWQDAQFALEAAELAASLSSVPSEQPTSDQKVDQQPVLPQQTATGHEKRSSPRRKYNYHQLIGPVYGDVLPSRQMFFSVACEDISAGGIAFYLDQAPDFHKVVIALGKPPTLAYFAADVVRYTKKQFGEKTMYLVGCRFTKRIPPSEIER